MKTNFRAAVITKVIAVGVYEDGPCRTPQLIELPACV